MTKDPQQPQAPRFLTVPGGGGSGLEHWQSSWEIKQAGMERIQQKDWNSPSREDWIQQIESTVRSSEQPAILVAHSVGCIAAVYAAASCPEQLIGLFLVAPADVDGNWANPPAPYATFRPAPLHKLRVPSLVIASDDDVYLTVSRAELLAESWGSELKVIGGLGHIGSDSGLGAWDDGLKLLNSFSSRCLGHRRSAYGISRL